MYTSWSGLANGSGRSTTPLMTLKIARVRADAECEREHGGEREDGDASEAARGLLELLRDLVRPIAAPHVARRLANGGLIAERAPRVARRLLRRFAARDAVARRHVQVSLHFGVQVAHARRSALPEHGQTSSAPVGGTNSSAIAFDICSHRERSAASRVRPAAVRR